MTQAGGTQHYQLGTAPVTGGSLVKQLDRQLAGPVTALVDEECFVFSEVKTSSHVDHPSYGDQL